MKFYISTKKFFSLHSVKTDITLVFSFYVNLNIWTELAQSFEWIITHWFKYNKTNCYKFTISQHGCNASVGGDGTTKEPHSPANLIY